MKNENLKVEDFISKIKEITDRGVAEIIKTHDRSFSFKVFSKWYEVSYINDFGMFLALFQGEGNTNMDDLICRSEWLPNRSALRRKGDLLFEYLDKIYASHLVFDNEKLIKSLRNYISLFSKCSRIEKLSKNIFAVNINDVNYIFERNEKYSLDDQYVSSVLEIKYRINNECKVKELNQNRKIDSIFSILNAIYFINKTESTELGEEEILNLFE